jgi:hypothetical protein
VKPALPRATKAEAPVPTASKVVPGTKVKATTIIAPASVPKVVPDAEVKPALPIATKAVPETLAADTTKTKLPKTIIAADLGAKVHKNISVSATSDDCIQLFDPCTREPIDSLAVLEKRIRELKRRANTTPIGLYDLTPDTTMYDFVNSVFVNREISLDDMVSFKLAEGRPPGSDIFEVLSRLFVFFGGIDTVNPRDGGNYKFMNRIESGGHVYDSAKQAFTAMKCIASKGSGLSDITLVNIRDDKKLIKLDDPYCEVDCDSTSSDSIKTYVMSVKWYKKEKNAEHYDLEKLFTLANHDITSAEQKPIGIIVFLKSKHDFQIAHNRAFRQYTRDLADTFFGWDEDIKPFLERKRREIFYYAEQKEISFINSLNEQFFISNVKPILSLQLHQEIITQGICDRIDKSDDNLFLIGVLPRGGKTFIAGGIIREFINRNETATLTVFWLTAAPNETMKQVKDELIDTFQDFNDFDFKDAKDSLREYKQIKRYAIIFCSSQLLLQSQKGAKRKYLDKLITGEDKLGLVFFDEAHKTGAGDETKTQISKLITAYTSYNLPFIFLTATYYNILLEYQIQKKNTFIWDYTDVLATRALATDSEAPAAIENLCARFDRELVHTILD